MRKALRLMFLLPLLCAAAFPQAAKPAPAAKPAETLPLSATESTAISALAEKLQKNSKDSSDVLDTLPRSTAEKIQSNAQERQTLLAAVKAIEAEIAAEHPGYHFDEQSGKIVKDAPQPDTAPKAKP